MREHLTLADHVRRWKHRLRSVANRSVVPAAIAAVVVLPTIPASDEAVEGSDDDAPGALIAEVQAPPSATMAVEPDVDPSVGNGTAAPYGLPTEITTIVAPAHWAGADFSSTEIPVSPPTGTGLTRGPPHSAAPDA